MLGKFELLVPGVSLLHELNKLVDGVIELLALDLPFLLVLDLDEPLNSPIWSLIGVVFVRILEAFARREVLPTRVKAEDLLRSRVSIAEGG